MTRMVAYTDALCNDDLRAILRLPARSQSHTIQERGEILATNLFGLEALPARRARQSHFGVRFADAVFKNVARSAIIPQALGL